MTKISSRLRRGFTLTEIAIVLGIMGLILGAIWAAASSVYNNQRINSASNDIASIVQGVRKLYAMSNGTGATANTNITGDLVLAKAVPSNMVNSGTTYVVGGADHTLDGPFPGGKTMITATSDGGSFAVVMSKVNTSNCISLLTSIGGNARDPGLFYAAATASEVHPALSDTPVAASPLNNPITASVATGAAGATIAGAGGCQASANTYKVVLGFSVK